jgi:hypothetical protein
MIRIRYLLDELIEQNLNDVGYGRRLKVGAGALSTDVGYEREGQRMPVREVEDVLVLLFRYGALLKIGPAFFGTQVPERDRAHHSLPGRIRSPCRGRRIAPGQDHQDIRGQFWKKNVAEPAVKRCKHLVRIDQNGVAT